MDSAPVERIVFRRPLSDPLAKGRRDRLGAIRKAGRCLCLEIDLCTNRRPCRTGASNLDALLNPVLAPVGTFDLERLGRAADGGYVVDPRAVMASERLISFGMNDEWSFEADFRALNPVQVDIFDHSVDADFFFRQAYQYLLRLDRPGLFLGSARIWLSYLRFVRGAVRHHKIMVGPARMNLLDLEGVIAMLDASDQRLFLSMISKDGKCAFSTRSSKMHIG